MSWLRPFLLIGNDPLADLYEDYKKNQTAPYSGCLILFDICLDGLYRYVALIRYSRSPGS